MYIRLFIFQEETHLPILSDPAPAALVVDGDNRSLMGARRGEQTAGIKCGR